MKGLSGAPNVDVALAGALKRLDGWSVDPVALAPKIEAFWAGGWLRGQEWHMSKVKTL